MSVTCSVAHNQEVSATTDGGLTQREAAPIADKNKRSMRFSILKGLAIIFVVLSHAGCPSWMARFVFQFHVPVFFICSGYFFKTRYLDNGLKFMGRRFRGLYLPFVRYSLFFLLIHNLLFPLGLLSERYGNDGGGVLHPYNLQQFCQRFWSILFNMSGYDEFLGGSFWFFRALLLASIGWFFAFYVLRKKCSRVQDWGITAVILCTAVAFASWQTLMGLRMTGVAQGGYRELTGLAFIAIGFLFRLYYERLPLNAWSALLSFALLCAGAIWFPGSMGYKHTFLQFLPLIPMGVLGFVLFLYLSGLIERRGGYLARLLSYIGEHTLYVFAFHLLAFKLVSALAVFYYHLPWEKMGSHTVVSETKQSSWFYLLYTLVGVFVPLLWMHVYKRLKMHFRRT